MKSTDTLGLAVSNLRRTRLRTALSGVGIAIGTAAVVSLLAAGNGFEQIAIDRASRFGALTTIEVDPETTSGQPHALTAAVLAQVKAIPHVARTLTTVITPPLRLQLGEKSIDLSSQAQTPLIAGLTMVSGAATVRANGIVLPASVATQLGVAPSELVGQSATLVSGSTVCCSSTRGGLNVVGADQAFPAIVVGVYKDRTDGGVTQRGPEAPQLLTTAELGVQIDAHFAGLTPEAYLQKVGYSGLAVETDDARQTARVASQIGALAFRTIDRADLLTQVHLVFNILKAALVALGSVALFVAAIGIANTMIMTVLERTREIGIMKALGAEPSSIRSLFLAESALVGVLGGAVGLVFSALAVFGGNLGFGGWIQSQDPNSGVGSLFVVSPLMIVGGLGLAVGVSLLGGALPSRRAVRLQPLDALRYE